MTDDLTFLHCDHVSRCTATVDKTFQGYASLQFMKEGTLFLSYDDAQYTLAGPSVWTAWPGPKTIFRRADDTPFWDHRYVAFCGSRVSSWMTQGLFPKVPMKIDKAQSLSEDFDRLIRSARRTDWVGRALAERQLEAVLLTLKDGSYSSDSSEDFISGVMAWMREQVYGRPNYGDLASNLNMAESTLRRRFREATGTALHTRYLELKLDVARELMSGSNLSIAKAAHQLGYSDVYYFTRQFAQHFGVPPATFRKSVQ
ncbi:MAG: AraC family transcriptional regulator [Pseudomonadota bacterium]